MPIMIKVDDASVVAALEESAKEHGLSRDEEAREVLTHALVGRSDNMASRLRARFEPLGGAELPIPDRPVSRDVPFLFEGIDEPGEDGTT